MKRKILSLVVVALMFCVIQCSSSENAHQIKQVSKIDVTEALKKGQFKTAIDASLIKVKSIKNGTIPVRGTLNLVGGTLTLDDAAKFLDLQIDMSSFDSGLHKRDTRISAVFFESQKPELAKASFVVNPLAADVITSFKTSKSFSNVAATGRWTFGGKHLDIPIVINGQFDDLGRLVVTTANPFQVKISDLGLSENLSKLIALCNHKSVDDLVEIEVLITFGL